MVLCVFLERLQADSPFRGIDWFHLPSKSAPWKIFSFTRLKAYGFATACMESAWTQYSQQTVLCIGVDSGNMIYLRL